VKEEQFTTPGQKVSFFPALHHLEPFSSTDVEYGTECTEGREWGATYACKGGYIFCPKTLLFVGAVGIGTSVVTGVAEKEEDMDDAREVALRLTLGTAEAVDVDEVFCEFASTGTAARAKAVREIERGSMACDGCQQG